MKTEQKTISIESIIKNDYHEKIYTPAADGYLDKSLERSGGKPINNLVVVKSEIHKGKYELVSGGTRYDFMVKNGVKDCVVTLIYLETNDSVEDVVVDLNKQRIKTGHELYNEFKHFSKKYPPIKGGNINRNVEIGLEMGFAPEKVKKLVMLYNQFNNTEFEFLIPWILQNKISLETAHQYRKLLKTSTNNYDVDTIKKLIENHCDYGRLSKLDKVIDLNNDSEFKVFNSFLQKNMSEDEYKNIVSSHKKTKGNVDKFINDRIIAPNVDDQFVSENSILLKGNSGNVDLSPINHLKGLIKCFVGSCEYGYDTKRPGREWEAEHEELKNMSSQEFAAHVAKIYYRYKDYLSEDGSIYVIINDYKKDKVYSLFVEYFVIEMEKLGFKIISKKMWLKTNPLPHGENVKDTTESFEYIYRFSCNPKKTFTKSLKMYDGEEISYQLVSGCTNHSNKETGVIGEKYIQSSLSNIRNTLSNTYCEDIIRGNVGNPGDYFRQLENKEDRHASTSPIYLTGVLTLEGSQKGDYIMDIWNGVGNTMMSSLLLGRKHIGIEIEEKYFIQSIKKAVMVEKFNKNKETKEIEIKQATAA